MMDKQVYKRYSEAFKRENVREYEAGASATRLREKYGSLQTIKSIFTRLNLIPIGRKILRPMRIKLRDHGN